MMIIIIWFKTNAYYRNRDNATYYSGVTLAGMTASSANYDVLYATLNIIDGVTGHVMKTIIGMDLRGMIQRSLEEFY